MRGYRPLHQAKRAINIIAKPTASVAGEIEWNRKSRSSNYLEQCAERTT
jgi:hypothetical protein